MYDLEINGVIFKIEEKGRSNGRVELIVNGKPVRVEILSGPTDRSDQIMRIGPRLLLCSLLEEGKGPSIDIWINNKQFRVMFTIPHATGVGADTPKTSYGPVSVAAPMAGRIVEVRASPGKEMVQGQLLVVLEAMKMENEITSPKNGVVRDVFVRVGSLVKAGDKLAVID